MLPIVNKEKKWTYVGVKFLAIEKIKQKPTFVMGQSIFAEDPTKSICAAARDRFSTLPTCSGEYDHQLTE